MERNFNILYIDDEEDLLLIVSVFFQAEYLPIHTCLNTEQALQMIEKTKYDLIISDGQMPFMSGSDFFTHLKREKLFNGKFILLTGEFDLNHDPNRQHYDRIILKPFDFLSLVRDVREVLNAEL
jgi:DNA-binding NtrC family response regulator